MLLQAIEIGERAFLRLHLLAIAADVMAARRPLFGRSHLLRLLTLREGLGRHEEQSSRQNCASDHQVASVSVPFVGGNQADTMMELISVG
jgi:hypothetical protein